MLAWEFIHGLLGNNEQGPKLTGTVINPQCVYLVLKIIDERI